MDKKIDFNDYEPDTLVLDYLKTYEPERYDEFVKKAKQKAEENRK